MTDLEKHPFYFNIELVENEINYLTCKGEFKKAIEVLEDVGYKWFKAKNENRVPTDERYQHLQYYALESIFFPIPNQKTNEPSTKIRDFLAIWIDDKIHAVKLMSDAKTTSNQSGVNLSDAELDSKKKFKDLKSIWIDKPSLTIEEVLEKGVVLGLWDEDYNMKSQRGNIYGSGKSLLSNLYIVLKENSIKGLLDHKEVGKVLCEFFNIPIQPKTQEPFKLFQQGNPKKIKELKKRFK